MSGIDEKICILVLKSSRHHHTKNEISWIALGDWGGQSVETIEPFHLLHEMPWEVYVTPKGFSVLHVPS